MLDLKTHYIGTYARNLIADWSLITRLIREKTEWTKEIISRQENPEMNVSPSISVMDDQQIDDALNGPFQDFFKTHLAAHADIARFEAAHTFMKEDQFKESETVDDFTLGIPPAKLNAIDFPALSALREQLNTLTREHITQWEAAEKDWAKTLLDALKELKISLNDIELQEFPLMQPASELNDRFVNLKLSLPKLDKEAFDFQQYWILKITLVIQSALSRMQLPNSVKDIESQLKLLTTPLTKIKQAHARLTAAQKTAVKKLLVPVTVA